MRWYQRFFRRARTERQLDAELRFHLEQQIADYVATGMTPEEARRRARLDFGGLDQVKEECRDVGAARFVENLIQDLRYGMRQLRRNPGFTAVAMITLALGIGANTAIFSVVYDVLLKPLPYPQPSRLIWVARTQPPFPPNWSLPFSGPNYLDLARLNHSFQYIAAMFHGDFSVTSHGEPERVTGEQVTADFFRVLGIQPMLGRGFLPGEDQAGHELEAVLSYGFWQRKFGGTRDIIGKTLTLNGQSYTIVGVMPRGFGYPSYGDEVWVPLVVPKTNRGDNNYRAIGRLKAGVTLAHARADLSTIARRLATEYPESNDREGVILIPLHERLGQFMRPTLLILFAAVGLLLLIACANVANLLLARGATRQREIAVRVALGVRRRRLIAQMLVESVLLALVGGAAALLVGYYSIDILHLLKPSDLPDLKHIGMSLPVLAFTLLLSVLTGIIFGLTPAFHVSGVRVNEALKSSDSGAGRSAEHGRTRRVLVVAQFALSLLLLVGAGLLIRSFARYVGVDPGFDPHHLLRFYVAAADSRYNSPRQIEQFYRAVLDRIRALPGIESAAISYPLPPASGESDGGFYVEGHKPASPSGEPDAYWHIIMPGYFHTMKTPILRGRSFTPDDSKTSPLVVIINQTLARHFFPHQNPLGRRLYVEAYGKLATIVGVAADQAYAGWDHLYGNEIYLPFAQLSWPGMYFVVRTKMASMAVVPEIRKAVWSVNKDLPVVEMMTMGKALDQAYGPRRFNMALLVAFAALGLCLAASGIYGIVSYHVIQRTHEIGIRMALGAQKRDVLRLVVGQGMILTLIGVGIGIIGALSLTRFLSSLLYGVKPTDPLTFVVASLILAAVALLACYIPARRATKVDPMVALRYE
jgi:predicted permease